jgi:outer membrane immunogenic protein
MKRFLLGTVALAALAVPATAADMGVRPRAVAYVPAFSWTGCHIGGLVGYEWGHSDGYTTTGASTTIRATPVPVLAGQPVYSGFGLDGFNGGGDIGCDYQFGAWVVGIEGDWSNVNKSGQGGTTLNTFSPGILSPGGGTTIFGNRTWTGEAQERWYATARGRFGYAVDRWLFFVSGGGAWTKVDQSQFIPGSPNNFAIDSNRLTGWTVGGGLEYAPPQLNGPFNGQWTIRAEYLYLHFRDYTAFTAPIFGASLGGFSNLSTSLDNHIVRFGLAYKFGNFAYAAR